MIKESVWVLVSRVTLVRTRLLVIAPYEIPNWVLRVIQSPILILQVICWEFLPAHRTRVMTLEPSKDATLMEEMLARQLIDFIIVFVRVLANEALFKLHVLGLEHF